MEVLRDFPRSGVCWYIGPDLINYLKSKNLRRSNVGSPLVTGVAWNSFGYWTVIGHSGQVEYSIEQLRPFFPKPDRLSECPVAPEECFLPEKWYINVNPVNILLVNEFLQWKKDEYIRYHPSWQPYNGCTFLYPQSCPGSYGGSNVLVPAGYIKITTEALVSHVLKHKQLNDNLNNEANERQESRGNSLKVQRSNITTRDSGDIGATGIRCSESKIKVGSGHLPD